MTTTLRVTLDPVAAPTPTGIGRYTEELTRALIDTAPPGCAVAGLTSAIPTDGADRIRTLLPDLAETIRLPLRPRAIEAAWTLGITGTGARTDTGEHRSRHGMTHATTPLAPLSRRSLDPELGDQTVVTIHTAAPWTTPSTLPRLQVLQHRMLARRAHRHADAVVVPSHTVAAQLAEHLDFGDRIRVIGGAVSNKLRVPLDADTRADRLGLPGDYLLAIGAITAHRRIPELIRALAHPDHPDLPLVIAGPRSDLDIDTLAADAGVTGRVHTLGFLPDADLAVVIDRAAALIHPSLASGFGLPVLEAFSLGTPVIHSSAPALLEIADGAGHTIPGDTAGDDYPARIARTVATVLDNTAETERMRVHGLDRARAFTWHNSAAQVWQLHADL